MSRPFFPIVLVLAVLLPLPALGHPDSPQSGVDDLSAPTIIEGQVMERLHLAFPQDPETTWFLSTFGAGRDGHRHIGNDLHAPKGSPVYAIAPGVVTRMAISGRAGAYLVIDHGPGWTSWYMHLDTDEPGTDNSRGGFGTAFAAGIVEGSFVDAGQLIGYVGDSGNAEGTVPHTHFELHRNGRPIDPYPLLLQAHERARMAVDAARLALLTNRVT
jgi:murein DD-endopeptidase MepM/ murein hydrolase activator NlpD